MIMMGFMLVTGTPVYAFIITSAPSMMRYTGACPTTVSFSATISTGTITTFPREVQWWFQNDYGWRTPVNLLRFDASGAQNVRIDMPFNKSTNLGIVYIRLNMRGADGSFYPVLSQRVSADANFGVTCLPDLSVNDILLDNMCNIVVQVKNTGGEIDNRIWQGNGGAIRISHGGGYRLWPLNVYDPTKALNITGTINYTSAHTYPDKVVGTENVTAMVDDGNSISEVNENNNETTKTLTCSSTPVQTSYAITATAGAGGSISPTGAVSVASGQSKVFTVVPNAGYNIAGVKVDGASVGAVTSYTFQNVNATHTIDAVFAATPSSYTINTSTDRGGSITPFGPVTVLSGQSRTFTMAANAGYRLGDVKIDGISVGAVGSYTFQNVAANHKITAVFAKNPYTITATAGVGGSISPSGTISVPSGQSGQNMVFTIVPNNTGYKIADVKVDGASVGSVAGYSFQNITANHTINATFSIKGNDSHEKDEKGKKKDKKK